MSNGTYYCVEVYLPVPINNSKLIRSYITQWSNSFGGTTAYVAEGRYFSDPPEVISIIRVYVPASFNRKDVIDYFNKRRIELENKFPDQKSFLITFYENVIFIWLYTNSTKSISKRSPDIK